MHRILHLSDLHFGKSHFYEQADLDEEALTAADAVSEAVRSHLEGQQIDALIMSGDFFSTDIPKDLPLAVDGVKRLVAELGVAPKCTCAVPGNHDIAWEEQFQRKPFRFYNDFVEQAGILGFATRNLPALLKLDSNEDDASRGVAIVLLDSCRMEGSKTAGIGRVGDMQLNRLQKLLSNGGVSNESHVLLAVLHHHLLPVVPHIKNWRGLKPKQGPPIVTSLTVDAVAVLQKLTDLGFSIAFHGHQHRPAVRKFEDILNGQPSINVCAAGSCAVQEVGVARQFFLYEVDAQRTRVWSFVQSSRSDRRFDRQERFINLSNSLGEFQTAEERIEQTNKAGLLAFFGNRHGSEAENALRNAFASQRGGMICMAGASLRFFLAPGESTMYKSVLGFLNRKCDENHAVVRALSCCPESNRELPIRSFVEEFGPDGSFPRTQPFDWTQPLMLCLDEFERQFFREHGMAASEDKQARAITDLRAVGGGVRELGGVAQMQGNRIEHRAVRYAPYCTTVIFPEKSFFTPNLLSPEVPVSFPMLVFGKNSDVHQKLLEYFEFQWWISASHD